jgi:uncharacterized protein (TIGR03067 family)
MYPRLLLLLGLILVVGFAPAPFPKRQREEPKTTLQRMQGWWTIVSERWSGQPGRTSGLRVHISGDTLQYYGGENKADGWTITVDDSIRPAGLDKTSLGSAKGSKPGYLGRVSVEGDILKVAWLTHNERSPDLTGARGACITFRRERK